MSSKVTCDLALIAMAAQSAYRVKANDKINRDDKPEYGEMLDDIDKKGYEIVDSISPKSSGGSNTTPLAATCMVPKEGAGGPIVISFRGTKTTRDIYSDIRLGTAGVVEKEFRDNAYQYYQTMKARYPGREIILTGHSLGGHLAQYVATKAYNEEPELKANPNIQVRTFNTAPINTKHAEVFIEKPSLLMKFKNYRLSSDLVSDLPFQQCYGDVYSFPYKKFAAHQMGDMVKGIPDDFLSHPIGMGKTIEIEHQLVAEQIKGALKSYQCRIDGQWFSKLRMGAKNLTELNNIYPSLIDAMNKKDYTGARNILSKVETKLSGATSSNLVKVLKHNIRVLAQHEVTQKAYQRPSLPSKKTFKDIGFKIDSELMSFIVGAVRGVKSDKVEDMADTLTDRPRPATFTEEEIAWMKETPISQITIGDNFTESSTTFFNLEVDGKPKLKISGRSTVNGEFRGDIVRDVISRAKLSENPDISVYDAFQKHISQVKNNANFIYASSPPIYKFMAQLGFDPKSPVFINIQAQLRSRMDDLGQTIFDSLDELNAHCSDSQELTEEAQQFLQSKMESILNKVPISQELIDFMESFKAFEEQLSIINEKLSTYQEGSQAHQAATTFSQTLTQARDQLISGDIKIQQFKDICNTACSTAENSVLKEHRGWKQVFSRIGLVVGSIASLGVANIVSKVKTGSFNFAKTNTDSINKMTEMKQRLKGITTSLDQVESHDVHDIDQEQDIEDRPSSTQFIT